MSAVVNAAHGDTLAREHLENASVRMPVAISPDVLECMSDLIADSWPEPTTTAELDVMLEIAIEKVADGRFPKTDFEVKQNFMRRMILMNSMTHY